MSAAVGANSVDAGVNLGGSGGGGGDAGSVTVNNSGSIRTGAVTSKDGTYKVSGLNSFGIYAQSVGGGGGAGGSAISGSLSLSTGNSADVGVNLGGQGGSGGSGGNVTVDNSAETIRTFGDYGAGIYAQSVGGGGGSGGSSSSFSLSGSSGGIRLMHKQM